MWHRDEARPTTFRGTRFRSALEAKVAEEFDRLGIEWEYERPVGESIPYLPDFTIVAAPPELELPQWVEVKPAELLYAVRDHVGCPELFEGKYASNITAQAIRDAQLTEAWKPKRLAEVDGRGVLVVSAINRTRTLSIAMYRDGIELWRSHPTVNARGVEKARQRDEDMKRWRAEAEHRRVAREAEQEAWRGQVVAFAREHGKAARFDGWCQVCQTGQPAARLIVFMASDNRWAAVCRDHLRTGERV